MKPLNIDDWYILASKYFLTIEDITKMKRGETKEVILLDRCFGEEAFYCNEVNKICKPHYFFRNNIGIIEYDQDMIYYLTLKKKTEYFKQIMEFHVNYHDYDWIPFIKGELPKENLFGESLDMFPKKWYDYPTNTNIGWEGPMLPCDKLDLLPDLYHNEEV